jgi:hypothetical protein
MLTEYSGNPGPYAPTKHGESSAESGADYRVASDCRICIHLLAISDMFRAVLRTLLSPTM